MITGYQFMERTRLLASSGLSSLKFYTVESNILVGIASFVLLVNEYRLLNNKQEKISKYAYILKFVATVSVCLTFIVTLFYLAPSLGNKFLSLYQNTNLFFHLIVPILSFISFVFYEKTNIEYKYTYLGIVTMIIYGIYYVVNVLLNLDNGNIVSSYDWYGFMKGGKVGSAIVFVIIVLITYLISFILWRLNKVEKGKGKENEKRN